MNEGKLGKVRYEIIEEFLYAYMREKDLDLLYGIRGLLLNYYKNDGNFVLSDAFIHEDGDKYLKEIVNDFMKTYEITNEEKTLMEKEGNFYFRSKIMWKILRDFKTLEEIYSMR